jgi:hypothetical protein
VTNPAKEALTRAVNRAIAEGAPVYVNQPPPMTPERVKQTGRQFGQKIGGKEARQIAALLKGWRK